jgi:TolB-like protein/Tfp pilus assembly protein PilF
LPHAAASSSPLVRFGVFELDLESGELRKQGRRVKIDHQPLRVLECLLEQPGRVVTREELRQKLWPSDTFVDFEQAINSTIKRLRQTIGDSSDSPHFVETLPRHGYRFICPVSGGPQAAGPEAASGPRQRIAAIALFAVASAALVAIGLNFRRPSEQMTAIAVLPFDNLTGQADLAYLVDAIHDELITELAQIGGLKVISRTSVLRFRHPAKPLREIAADLDVDGVVEGAVSRDGQRWHVTAQLISARDDHHVWAASYERSDRELAVIPRQITREILGRLGIKVLPHEQARLAKTEAIRPEAFRAYSNGQYYAAKLTPDALQKAVHHFHEALDLDPSYAAAWQALGSAYEALGNWGGRSDDRRGAQAEFRLRAFAALQRAVDLDPGLRESHQALGRMRFAEWEWEEGKKAFERAREVDPTYPGFTIYLLATARFDEAFDAQRRAAELDPLNYYTQVAVGWTAFMAGRYDDGIAALRSVIDLNPALPPAHYELAWCLAKKGKYTEALTECDTSLALLRRQQPKTYVAQACEWVYAAAGRRREALEFARRIEADLEDDARFTRLAHVYDALGERDRALAYLEKAYQQKAASLPRQWYVPMLSDEIKADPRFQDIIRRTGQPWAKFPSPRATGQPR